MNATKMYSGTQQLPLPVKKGNYRGLRGVDELGKRHRTRGRDREWEWDLVW